MFVKAQGQTQIDVFLFLSCNIVFLTIKLSASAAQTVLYLFNMIIQLG